MNTLFMIADEYDMQPHELAAFLGTDIGYDEEIEDEEAQNIRDLLDYDRLINIG